MRFFNKRKQTFKPFKQVTRYSNSTTIEKTPIVEEKIAVEENIVIEPIEVDVEEEKTDIVENNVETKSTIKNKNAIKDFSNSTILHVKNSCLFSINALNKLIETINDNKEVDNKDFKMNWDDYKDKLIILSSNELNIHNINKIEDKCVFFT